MQPAEQQQSATFNLSPSAISAVTLMQQRLNRLLIECASQAQTAGYSVSEQYAQKFGDRVPVALHYFEPKLKQVFDWLFASSETSNFTYSLSQSNIDYLACFVSTITSVSVAKIRGYLSELQGDQQLREHVLRIASSGQHYIDIDPKFDFGRRLGWYAVVRAIKPRVVVETGVEQGLGSLVLTAALRRNAQEGAPGVYRGTDINPNAGYLFQGEYREWGTILYGDSIESLQKLDERIDLFINDSDHSAEYEEREYEVVQSMLADRSIILGDNSHVTDKLCRFALSTGRRFLFFQEKPKDHWYPGAGIGAAF